MTRRRVDWPVVAIYLSIATWLVIVWSRVGLAVVAWWGGRG